MGGGGGIPIGFPPSQIPNGDVVNNSQKATKIAKLSGFQNFWRLLILKFLLLKDFYVVLRHFFSLKFNTSFPSSVLGQLNFGFSDMHLWRIETCLKRCQRHNIWFRAQEKVWPKYHFFCYLLSNFLVNSWFHELKQIQHKLSNLWHLVYLFQLLKQLGKDSTWKDTKKMFS